MKLMMWKSLTACTLLALASSHVAAAEPEPSSKIEAESIAAVDMFQAIEEGKIEVNFYPKDASQATVVIKNKGKEPVNVVLPKAFGAVHVLGQMGMGGGGYGGGMGGMGGGMGGMGGGMGGMGGGQGMGGGMGGMGGGMGGMGGGMGGMGGMGGGMMGGGMFRVEPDKTRKLKVPCVCLEHGKPDPNPRMKYKIVPIEKVNNDPRVSKLCELLGYGRVPQNTAQAAAWHMANELSWQELAYKNRVESKYTGNVRFFSPVELNRAFRIANVIRREYEKSNADSSSSGYEEATTVSEAAAPSEG